MPELPAGSTPYYSITINNLYAKWNELDAVDTLKDICLSVREKQVLAVVGDSGSGKVKNQFSHDHFIKTVVTIWLLN